MRLIAGFSLRGAHRTIDVHLSCMTPLPGASLDSPLPSRPAPTASPDSAGAALLLPVL